MAAAIGPRPLLSAGVLPSKDRNHTIDETEENTARGPRGMMNAHLAVRMMLSYLLSAKVQKHALSTDRPQATCLLVPTWTSKVTSPPNLRLFALESMIKPSHKG